MTPSSTLPGNRVAYSAVLRIVMGDDEDDEDEETVACMRNDSDQPS
jgi:hypothetical protein